MRNVQSPIPSRESCHTQQLLSLLQIAHALQPYLLLPHPEIGVEQPKLDGGALSAAAATFMGTCAKLDELLADKSRWSLAPQDELYESLVKTQQEQQEFLRAQTAAAEGLRRPSYQLRPVLATYEGGFLAIWGNVEVPGGSIVGKGATPELALADFDAAFSRTPDKQVAIIAEMEDTPPVGKPRRKKK